MKASPQLKLTIGLVMLVVSTAFVADVLGLLPNPEGQVRETRKLLGESLAVQLSSAVSNNANEMVVDTLEKLVERNDEIVHAGLYRADDTPVVSYGEPESRLSLPDASSLDHLIVPIFDGGRRWGEMRLDFANNGDWGLQYIGFPTQMLQFMAFLALASLLSFYVFLRRALSEMNPSKVVPQRVNAAFDVLAEGVIITDEKERIVLANESFASRVGTDPEALVGRRLDSFTWDLKGDHIEVLPWQSAVQHGESIQGMPLRLQNETDAVAFTVNAAPIADGQGSHRGCLVTFDDVTPLEAKNEKLAEMLAKLSSTQAMIEEKNKELEVLATRDSLTGCFNRRSFVDRYQKQFKAASQNSTPLSLLMVDIDHFKLVNDNYGHPMGDRVIKLVAAVLQDQFERVGTVGRYGGEEFVVSLPGMTLEDALGAAEQTRQTIAALVTAEGLPMPKLTASIGAAHLAEAPLNPDDLLDQADRGLYKAKESGRDRVCAFDPAWGSDEAEKPKAAAEQPEAEPSAASERAQRGISKLRDRLTSMRKVVHKQAREITYQSMHDRLTGLPNRYLLLDRLTQAIKQSARNENLTAVLSVSLSSYQYVHDHQGGEAAEELLKQASTRMESVVRAVDTIGVAFNEQALTCSRVAQNELALLVVDLDSAESVSKIIDRLTAALSKPFPLESTDVLTQVHCGIALYPHDGDDAETLLRNASLAGSYARRRESHRSASAFFSSDLDAMAIKNAKIARELRKAIEQDGLSLVYQPKIDLHTEKVCGVEALARWHHPDLGHIGPMEFISVAEQIGLIDQLTSWVVRRVCDDMTQLRNPDVRASVNVSPIELYDADSADRILNILNKTGLNPNLFEVEITETSMLNNFDRARTILNRLRETGIHVSLDDFGTGYSSLNLLREMPVDVIKIDRSFVSDIQEVMENRAVVEAIVQMSHAMGKRVVAEGVENVLERDCLIELGCNEVQGYLYSKPLSFEEFAKFIAARGSIRLDPQQRARKSA